MDKKELCENVICALTHNINVCDNCKICGPDGPTIRMNFCRMLAKELGGKVPWNEEDTKEQ